MGKSTRINLIKAAQGEILCSLCIKNAQVVNFFTKEILQASVYIYDEYIVDVDYEENSSCKPEKTLDAHNQ